MGCGCEHGVCESRSRQGDRPKSPPPCGLRAQRHCFFVAPPRRCRASTRRHASNQKPFHPQQITCYLWDRTLQHRRRRTTKRSTATTMLPKGYRRREPIYFVPAPRRCQHRLRRRGLVSGLTAPVTQSEPLLGQVPIVQSLRLPHAFLAGNSSRSQVASGCSGSKSVRRKGPRSLLRPCR